MLTETKVLKLIPTKQLLSFFIRDFASNYHTLIISIHFVSPRFPQYLGLFCH